MIKFLGIAVVLATGLTAASATEIVNFGVQPATQPIYIARAAGFLDPIEKKHDVKIEFKSFAYGAPENQALAAGELQIAAAGMGPAVLASSRLPVELIAIDILDQTAVLVPPQSTVKDIKDLRGKKIAFPGTGSQQYPLILKALADAGMKENDVELIKAQPSQIGNLLRSGSVDAGITFDPHISSAIVDGSAKLLMKSSAIFPLKSGHYVGGGIYARQDFIRKHPGLVEDLMVAVIKSIKLIETKPETAIDMWTSQIGFLRPVIAYSVSNGISVFHSDIAPEKDALEKYVTLLRTSGILEAGDEPKINSSFAQKAQAAADK